MNLENKRILVTGGAGFLGRHVVQELLDRGVPTENIFAPRSEKFDLRKKENCAAVLRGQDIVIHLAGTTGGITFHKEHPAQTFYDNLMMGAELMEAARTSGVEKFVTIGSAAEYPERAPLPFRETDLWVGPPEEIHVPYAIAKRMLLVQAQAYRKQYGFNGIHLLMANMYGPGDYASTFVLPTLAKRIQEAEKRMSGFIEVWGTGKATRDFLYVRDAAKGIVLATEKYDSSEPVNIASGEEISIRKAVETLARLMNFKGEIRWDRTKPDGQLRRILDSSRAEKEFGFKAPTDFETGIKKTLQSYHA